MTNTKHERTYVSNTVSLPLAGVVGAVATGVTVALLDTVLGEMAAGDVTGNPCPRDIGRRINPDDIEIIPDWHGRDHKRRWMTIPEAAEYARTDVDTLREAIAAGDIRPYHASPKSPFVVDSADVDAWILHEWMGEFSEN